GGPHSTPHGGSHEAYSSDGVASVPAVAPFQPPLSPSTAQAPPGLAHPSTHGPTSFSPGVPGQMHGLANSPLEPTMPGGAPPQAAAPFSSSGSPSFGAPASSGGGTYDGLAAFVRGIRATHSSPAPSAFAA